MMKNKKGDREIYYKEIMDLGFDSIPSHDKVWESRYGYPYVIYNLNLTKNVYVNWDQPSRHCEMIRVTKDGTILSRWPISGLDELKRLHSFFNEEKSRVNFSPKTYVPKAM